MLPQGGGGEREIQKGWETRLHVKEARKERDRQMDKEQTEPAESG